MDVLTLQILDVKNLQKLRVGHFTDLNRHDGHAEFSRGFIPVVACRNLVLPGFRRGPNQ